LSRGLVLAVLLAALASPGGASGAEVFKPRYRSAEELVPVAEGILGPGGLVAADPRTGWLILRGEPGPVAEAVETLQRLDVRPASYRVSSALTRTADLERAGVSVSGWVRAGDVRIGRAGWVPRGLWVSPRGLLAQQESTFNGEVAVLEGNAAEIWTGTVFPERESFRDERGGRVRVYETATLVPVQTGFRVRPRGRADGSIEVELTPVIAERSAEGTIVRAAAATAVVVRPGETVVIASAHETGAQIALDPFATLDHREGANDSAMLVRVEKDGSEAVAGERAP
jgi:type II secretory pathway component GspD/PulD (secretin)